MHTMGQHKRLSLAREEGDPTKSGAGSDFVGAGSGSGLFRCTDETGYLSDCATNNIFALW